MTSREKVLDLEKQVRHMISGVRDPIIHCPFCGLDTNLGDFEQNVLCCNEATGVIDAIVNHLEFLKGQELVDKVMDRFEKIRESAAVN